MRSVILGAYYYPADGPRWLSCGPGTEFEPGQTIIVQDSRVVLVREGEPTPPLAELVYQLNDKEKNLTFLVHQVDEFCIPKVFGAHTGWPSSEPDRFAIIVPIEDVPGPVHAEFSYYDSDARGGGGTAKLLEIASADIATIRQTSGTIQQPPQPPIPPVGPPAPPDYAPADEWVVPAGSAALVCYVDNSGSYPVLHLEDGTIWHPLPKG